MQHGADCLPSPPQAAPGRVLSNNGPRGSVAVLFLAAALTGCVGQLDYEYGPDEEARLELAVLGDSQAVDLSRDVLSLDETTRAYLDSKVRAQWGDRRKLNQLRKVLFSEQELNIQYEPLNTRTASQTYASREGNCLSMTNLFIAAARHVGLDASYQQVSVRPTWDNQGNTMIRYEHIVAVGKLRTGEEYVVDFLPGPRLLEERKDTLSDVDALALFYNNLGAEAIVEGDHESALRHLRQALKIQPEFADAWNNIGAAMSRTGHSEPAEFSYRRALHVDAQNGSALNNLARFFESEGRQDEAQQLVRRVNRYRARNPYFHYFLGLYLFDEGRYEDAQKVLERSIRLESDQPDFYLALARTYAQLGDERAARRMRQRAKSLGGEVGRDVSAPENEPTVPTGGGSS